MIFSGQHVRQSVPDMKCNRREGKMKENIKIKMVLEKGGGSRSTKRYGPGVDEE